MRVVSSVELCPVASPRACPNHGNRKVIDCRLRIQRAENLSQNDNMECVSSTRHSASANPPIFAQVFAQG